MKGENMIAEIMAMIDVAIYNLKLTKWYVFLAKLGHLVFMAAGMQIAIALGSDIMGLIVILITIAYVVFYGAWLGKRID
jgi:hypothetical protein